MTPVKTIHQPELDTPTAKLVYTAIDIRGSVTVDDLRTSLDLKKITLFSVLEGLRRKDLVTLDDGGRYVCA